MKTDLIIVTEYCENCNIEPSFIFQLGEDGLIDILIIEQKHYLYISQLNEIERFSRLYYELSINVPGIGAVEHLLKQMDELKREIHFLRNQLSISKNSNPEGIEEEQ